MVVENIADTLHGWYARHARTLPWRQPPGTNEAADPYRVWLSEVMLQQTTVAAVTPYFDLFTRRWPTVQALAAADDADVMAAWAGLGYYSRARNLLACARMVVDRHHGHFPRDEAILLTLPGIGAYTAAAIAAIAFGQPANVVDGNVERVVSRLFAVETPLPSARPELKRLAAGLTPLLNAGDHAQAMMDLGATICTPRNPHCLACPLRDHCRAFALGDPARFPLKAPRAARPERQGTAFWLENSHGTSVLLVRRPSRGLLGGMRALPTGEWAEQPSTLAGAPAAVEWAMAATAARHVFTHFGLTLGVAIGQAMEGTEMVDGEWWPINDLDDAGLPTVFAKAARIALSLRETAGPAAVEG